MKMDNKLIKDLGKMSYSHKKSLLVIFSDGTNFYYFLLFVSLTKHSGLECELTRIESHSEWFTFFFSEPFTFLSLI